MTRVGQKRIYAPYRTVYSVISLPKILYIHRIYMVLANPTHDAVFATFCDTSEKRVFCPPSGVCVWCVQKVAIRLS